MATDDEWQRFLRRTYVTKDAQGNQILGVKATSPQLTIDRMRRCQNCVHFDDDEKAKSHFRACVERDRKNLAADGHSEHAIRRHIGRLHRIVGDRLGEWGLCLARDKRTDEGAAADFTHYGHRCDHWSGRLVVSPFERHDDPDAAEVLDRLGLPSDE